MVDVLFILKLIILLWFVFNVVFIMFIMFFVGLERIVFFFWKFFELVSLLLDCINMRWFFVDVDILLISVFIYMVRIGDR